MRPVLQHRTRCLHGWNQASMIQLDRPAYNSDGGSHDVCPTCGAPVRTTTPADADATYRLSCTHCSWRVDLEPSPARRVVTDGGTRATTSRDEPKSARDVLDELHYDDSAARVAEQIETGDCPELTPTDILRTLALAEDRLCMIFEHDTGTEYVWLADGWRRLDARLLRDRDGGTIDVTMGPDDLTKRLDRLEDVELVGSTTVPRPHSNGGGSA